MKTSLVIDDALYQAAKKHAEKHGTTLSETISEWAKTGFQMLKQKKNDYQKKSFTPLDGGGPPYINIHNRNEWLDELDISKE